MRRFRSFALAAVALALLAVNAPGVAAAPPTPHVRGTLTRVTATRLTIATAGGPVVLAIDGKTRVVGVTRGKLADITSGTFIGTANVVGAGPARALEVVVFPKSMVGAGEGDYAWDLPAGHERSSMTNGTVAGHRHSMMTNATVTGIDNGASKTVTLTYQGGSKQVTIAPGTPIVRAMPGSPALLAVGARVVAPLPAAGQPTPVVIVGIRGTIPPM